VKSVLGALRSGRVKAFAHITGGGLSENIPRVLPKTLGVDLDAAKWPIPPIFPWIAAAGGVSEIEMLRTFNCGLGAILIVSPAEQQYVLSMMTDENTYIVGQVKNVYGGRFIITNRVVESNLLLNIYSNSLSNYLNFR
jgi:phosphoribosylamine--glycine ligase/phosphoribosylglycinamide formyltransferase/phosphoribosylformylglycinamidine cyclo-ligase